jgi:lysophospholipase L1-like esterase
MHKNLLINIGLLAGTVLAFFLIIELGLRITGLQTVKPNPPKIYHQSENPEISYELIPDLRDEKAYKAIVSTDSWGFRLNSRSPKPSNRKLIALLGDSITFGHGVHNNQTLPAQLTARNINAHYLNTAVPGYQLGQQTALYREKIQPLNPDGVMLVFYWNDLNAGPPGILDDQGILRGHDWIPTERMCQPIETGVMGLIPGKCWLDTHSAFYKAMKNVMNLKASKKNQQEEREVAEQNTDPTSLSDYALKLSALAQDLPSNRTFVIWPDNFLHTEQKPQLIQIAKRNGFTVIDLYELFGNNVETLIWDTVHPSPKAIEEAAQYITEKLYSE